MVPFSPFVRRAGGALLPRCAPGPPGAGQPKFWPKVAIDLTASLSSCLRRSGDRGFEGNSSSEAETAFDSM